MENPNRWRKLQGITGNSYFIQNILSLGIHTLICRKEAQGWHLC